MQKKIVKTLAATLVLGGALVATKPALATPSTLGFYPSTDVYGDGVFHLDLDTYSKGLKESFFTTTGLTYGVGNRAEIGLDYNIGGALTSVSDRVFFNAKYKVVDGGAEGVTVAAGGWGIGTKSLNPNIGYVNASKNFGFGRLTVGVARSFGRAAVVGDNKTSLQLGYDKFLTPKLQFAVDYYSGKNSYAGVQPTLYYYINDKANFGLGVMRFNSSQNLAGAPRTQIYACFDYNFDFAGTPTVVAPAPAPETTTGTAKN